jgi:hypothetical protein
MAHEKFAILKLAYSGHREQPDRSMVNAPIGDRDRSGATLGVGG